MPNIVYVLINQGMPGIVKIGMTGRDDVQQRMTELYSTGVPFPFECVIARQIEDREAAKVERALHTAFDPYRVNSSREFFKIDPEQAVVLLQVMPGQDVTPGVSEQITWLQPEGSEAAEQYKKGQDRTNEEDFLELLNENGLRVYQKVLAIGSREGMHINWGRKGFSLNTVSNGVKVVICKGYPPSAFHQQIFTDFALVVRKTKVPEEVIDTLRNDALNTGLFAPMGKGKDVAYRTDRALAEAQIDTLIEWLEKVIATVREYQTPSPEEREKHV